MGLFGHADRSGEFESHTIVVEDHEEQSGGDGSPDDSSPLVERNDRGFYGTQGRDVRKSGGARRDEAIDVLYENQRGAFLCGVAMFSAQTLSAFDPSSWSDRRGKYSPVDIHMATCPDPSWQWDWQHWFVDMTGDMDEDGWSYAFDFRSRNWHGSHGFLNSFVRRRRWLRKRVRKNEFIRRDPGGHDFASQMTPSTNMHSQHVPGQMDDLDDHDGSSISSASSHDSISDYPHLIRKLKKARIDREKISAFERFLEDGGTEVCVLVDKIPEVMSFMLFQESRRKFVTLLHQTRMDAEKDEYTRTSDSPNGRIKLEKLREITRLAEQYVSKLDFWSDKKKANEQMDDQMEGEVHFEQRHEAKKSA